MDVIPTLLASRQVYLYFFVVSDEFSRRLNKLKSIGKVSSTKMREIVVNRQNVAKKIKPNTTVSSSTKTNDVFKKKIEYSDIVATKQCPKCAEIIRLEALVCRFCDHKFDENEVSGIIAKLENEEREAEESKQKAIREKEDEENRATLFKAKKKALRWNETLRSVYKYIGLLLITIGSLGLLIFTVSFIHSPKAFDDIAVVLILYVLIVIMLIMPGLAFRKAEKKRLLEITKIKNEINENSENPENPSVKDEGDFDLYSTSKEILEAKSYKVEPIGSMWEVKGQGVSEFFETLESLNAYAKSRK